MTLPTPGESGPPQVPVQDPWWRGLLDARQRRPYHNTYAGAHARTEYAEGYAYAYRVGALSPLPQHGAAK